MSVYSLTDARASALLKLRDTDGARAGICMDDPGRILVTVGPIGGPCARYVDVIVWPDQFQSPQAFNPDDTCPAISDAKRVTFRPHLLAHSRSVAYAYVNDEVTDLATLDAFLATAHLRQRPEPRSRRRRAIDIHRAQSPMQVIERGDGLRRPGAQARSSTQARRHFGKLRGKRSDRESLAARNTRDGMKKGSQ